MSMIDSIRRQITPIHPEGYIFVAGFALATALSLLALVTLALKTLAEWENRRQFEAGQQAILETTIDITSLEQSA